MKARRFPATLPPMARAAALVAVILFPPVAGAVEGPGSFSVLARKLVPAVVGITTTQMVERNASPDTRGPERPEGGPPLDEFFQDFFGGNPPARRVEVLGSGFIIDPKGYIVTNHHVIAEGKDIKVNLSDGRSLDAEVVGTDPPTDLALLKIDAGGPLPYVRWGSSDSVAIGDWVVAIGNSFGLSSTLTAGVLSGRARDIQAGPYDDFLQTDAAINTGNSGGPLFDMKGTVIGVNTAILSPTGGNIGIGFAIPASTARPIVEQLRRHGTVRRGWLGVQIQSMTEELAEAVGLDKPRGALVADVIAGGPAAKAGMRPGDVILSFDGMLVRRTKDLPRIVANTEIGKRVEIKIWREGSEQLLTATVVLRESAGADAGKRPGAGPGKEPQTAALGMSLAPLDDEVRRRLELDKSISGVVVTAVQPDGPAANQGLRPGDVIVEVSRQPVTHPRQVIEKIEKARREGRSSALIRIHRDGSYQFAAVPV